MKYMETRETAPNLASFLLKWGIIALVLGLLSCSSNEVEASNLNSAISETVYSKNTHVQVVPDYSLVDILINVALTSLIILVVVRLNRHDTIRNMISKGSNGKTQ
ncbi:MAG: hypothetical protein AAFX87_00735 [Bacteroidota bacterium]